ncbi:MAG: hypothetical protein ACI4IW_04250 [Oscillospiraceae bacterium]
MKTADRELWYAGCNAISAANGFGVNSDNTIKKAPAKAYTIPVQLLKPCCKPVIKAFCKYKK